MRPGGRCVHSGSLGPFGCALGSLGSFGAVGYILVLPRRRWVCLAKGCAARHYTNASGPVLTECSHGMSVGCQPHVLGPVSHKKCPNGEDHNQQQQTLELLTKPVRPKTRKSPASRRMSPHHRSRPELGLAWKGTNGSLSWSRSERCPT